MAKWVLVLAVITACEDPARPARKGAIAPESIDAGIAAKAAPDGAPVRRARGPLPPQRTTWPKSPAGDCSTKYAPDPERDAAPVCRIAGGTFMFGEADERGDGLRLIKRKVTLSPYFIDQFEVTAEQYVRFLVDVGNDCGERPCVSVHDPRLVDWPMPIAAVEDTFAVREGFEGHPADGVSWEGARRYCEWAGKQLPTDAQWEFVATVDRKTGKKRLLPWGDRWKEGTANCAEEPYRDHEACADGFERGAPVGTFPRGASTWGPQDLIGNVAEWVADCSTSFPDRDGPECGLPGCKDPPPRTECGRYPNRVIRGNGYTGWRDDAHWRSRLLYPSGAPGQGFRCAFRGGI